MTSTLAAFIVPGDVIETPLWDGRANRRCRAEVTSVIPMRDRLRVGYRYPSGYESFQMLRGHDLVPLPSDVVPDVGGG